MKYRTSAGLVPAFLLLCSGLLPLKAAITLKLTPSESSPKAVGTFLTWEATAEDTEEGDLRYRFRVREAGGQFRTIRDFGHVASLLWAPVDHEGIFEMEVTVRNRRTGETRTASALFHALTPTPDGVPVVKATPNPLVFLYSAPPCDAGSQMRVVFRAADSGVQQYTPAKPCDGQHTMNFYIAGIRVGTEYSAMHQIIAGQQPVEGPSVSFKTVSELPIAMPTYDVTSGTPQQGVLLRSALNFPSLATDLAGRVVWYYQHELTFITRAGSNSTFLGIAQNEAQPEFLQGIKQFDLAGLTIAETNAERINDQLEALGKRRIGAFHHEVRELPDGKILALAGVEEEMENVQGDGLVNILGDAIVVLDRDLNVVWSWDGFDHINPTRAAILGETCPQGGCPSTYRSPVANDWLHTNSVQLTPDNHLIASIRHLDAAIKIDYDNGKGSGAILWELGRDGNFTIDSPHPEPWFSHQHDVQYIDKDTIILFDNGNTRQFWNPEAKSRGQVIRLDEANRKATVIHDFDLGIYSFALGSAQRLPNGNFHFNIGYVPPFKAVSVEVDSSGSTVYSVASSTAEYRAARMPSVYQEY